MKATKQDTKYYIILFFELIFSSVRIFQKSIWADEIFTVKLVELPYKGMVIGTMQDVHPPLYYLINKFICGIFGYSLPVFKAVSLLPIVILAFVGYKWMTKHFDKLSGFIFASLVLLMPTAYYNTEIRMYSWALFFVTLFTFTITDGIEFNDNKKVLAASLFAILGAFTHYFVLLIVGSVYFYYLLKCLIKKINIKYLIGSIIICIVVYLPWLIIAFGQMNGEDAYSMGVNSITYYLKPFIGFICLVFGTMQSMADITIHELALTMVLALLFVVTVAVFLRKHWTDEKGNIVKNICLLYMFTFALIYICGCVMDLMSHKFVSRYLIPSAGILFIVLAASVASFIKDNSSLMHSVIFTAIAFIVILDFGTIIYGEVKADKNQKLFINTVEDMISENDLVLTDSRLYNWIVFDHYFDGMNYLFCENADILNAKAAKYEDNVYYIHNKNDVLIQDPGNDWEYVLSSEFAENKVELYKYVPKN